MKRYPAFDPLEYVDWTPDGDIIKRVFLADSIGGPADNDAELAFVVGAAVGETNRYPL